jgi:hypothetical protein
MSWEPMSREHAQMVVDEFFASRGAVTVPFEQHVALREALLVLMGAEPEVIRRELEQKWDLPLA